MLNARIPLPFLLVPLLIFTVAVLTAFARKGIHIQKALFASDVQAFGI